MKKLQILLYVIVSSLFVCLIFVSCISSGSEEEKDEDAVTSATSAVSSSSAASSSSSSASAEGDFEFSFIEGFEGYYPPVYAAWIENEALDYIQNIFICERLVTAGALTGTVLPYWTMHKYPDSSVDGVTGASVKNGEVNNNFPVTFSLNDTSIRQFTVYFEIDSSSMYNEWFTPITDPSVLPGYYVYDQPAILYKADVDLDDASKTVYELTLYAWTPNADTPRTVFTPVPAMVNGVPHTELRYITNHKALVDGIYVFGGADPDKSIARIVNKITLTIK